MPWCEPKRPLAQPLRLGDARLLDGDLEARDDPRIAAPREQLGVGIARRHPRVAVLGVSDDVGEAPGAGREDPRGLFRRIAERVQAGTPLRAEDDVTGG